MDYIWINNKALLIILTAATPVVELRGAIPMGLALDMAPFEVLLLSLLGNILPIPFILLGIDWLLSELKKIPRLHQWIDQKGQRGAGVLHQKIQRWGWLGLMLFVAIPLPGTGAWTGALAASFLRLKFWSSLLAISAGVLIAALLVTGASLGVISLL